MAELTLEQIISVHCITVTLHSCLHPEVELSISPFSDEEKRPLIVAFIKVE